MRRRDRRRALLRAPLARGGVLGARLPRPRAHGCAAGRRRGFRGRDAVAAGIGAVRSSGRRHARSPVCGSRAAGRAAAAVGPPRGARDVAREDRAPSLGVAAAVGQRRAGVPGRELLRRRRTEAFQAGVPMKRRRLGLALGWPRPASSRLPRARRRRGVHRRERAVARASGAKASCTTRSSSSPPAPTRAAPPR